MFHSPVYRLFAGQVSCFASGTCNELPEWRSAGQCGLKMPGLKLPRSTGAGLWAGYFVRTPLHICSTYKDSLRE